MNTLVSISSVVTDMSPAYVIGTICLGYIVSYLIAAIAGMGRTR